MSFIKKLNSFELTLARKYLLPRRKQLSVSLICMLSVGVITLVVWLLLTFLSVMGGIEDNWLHKLTSLNAPIKVQPTHKYFKSYYYQVDSIASESGYALKTLGEKKRAHHADPYDANMDMEIPMEWPAPAKTADGATRDLVKEAFATIQTLPNVAAQEFDLSGAILRVHLKRGDYHSYLTQAAYVTTYADQSPTVQKLLLEQAELTPNEKGEPGVFLPKSFLDSGVRIGDRGYLGYSGSGASSGMQQQLGIYVAGFYDPGIMAVGPKCVLAPSNVAEILHSSGDEAFALDPTQSTGIQVWFDDLSKTQDYANTLKAQFDAQGLSDYFHIVTYHDYDFAKDLLLQFQSDKMLFTLVAIIILVVAASNIVSSLILLVSNKKREIGILQSMGASKRSIATIFALCGMAIGLISTLAGGLAAYLTLHNIDSIVHFLSWIQGHDVFNAMFYGSSLPSELSSSALRFILIATPIISLLAGLIPAIKASRLEITDILRAS